MPQIAVALCLECTGDSITWLTAFTAHDHGTAVWWVRTASVMFLEESWSNTPSSALLLAMRKRRSRTRSSTSYRQTNFELPPASKYAPSAE